MEIGLSLLPGPHSGTHLLRTSGCVPPWQHLKPILKHIFLRKLTRYDCVPYRYILLQICFYHLHGFFTFITSLYQLCQSLVIIECHILMLYHNCITLIYFIALYVLFVFYIQRWRNCGSALYKSINYHIIIIMFWICAFHVWSVVQPGVGVTKAPFVNYSNHIHI